MNRTLTQTAAVGMAVGLVLFFLSTIHMPVWKASQEARSNAIQTVERLERQQIVQSRTAELSELIAQLNQLSVEELLFQGRTLAEKDAGFQQALGSFVLSTGATLNSMSGYSLGNEGGLTLLGARLELICTTEQFAEVLSAFKSSRRLITVQQAETRLRRGEDEFGPASLLASLEVIGFAGP